MRAKAATGLISLMILCGAAQAAPDPSYPFVGNWIRSDRACSASTARERIYTAKEVTSSRGRCAIRRVAHGSGGYELFERCERPNEKPANVSEIIRMSGLDAMVLTRQTARLKLSRSLHFSRCSGPSAAPGKPH